MTFLFLLFCIPLIFSLSKPLSLAKMKGKDRLLSLETPQFRVLKRFERKGKLFYTQGLVFKDANTLIESAGLYGHSELHFLNLDDLEIKNSVNLSNQFFAEGCTIIPKNDGVNEIYQLTWRERKIFVYDGETLASKRTINLPQPISEGWGLAHQTKNDKTKLFVTDGSYKVFVLDPETFEIEKTLEVNDNGQKISFLNELEFIGDVLLANVYLTNTIVAIDINNGKVLRTIDCSVLVNEVTNSQVFKSNFFDGSYCLNGIAYHDETNTLVITGKKWPFIYQIELRESF